MGKNPFQLTIIVPTYNRAEEIGVLLSSLEKDLHRIEIIIVDDCSTDSNIYNNIKEAYPTVRFIRTDQNVGPAKARNLGSQEAQSDLLLFLDSDTFLVPGSIDAVVEFFKKNQSIHVVSGWDDFPPLNEGFFPNFRALSLVSESPANDCEISFVAGRCFAIRRKAMFQIKGFSEKYGGADVEDYELGYRLKKQYGVIWFLSNLKVRHKYPGILKQFKLYFHRVKLWMDLRPILGGFDNSMGTSYKDAIINIFSALWPFFFISSWLTDYLLIGIIFIAISIFLNRKLLILCLNHQGLLFTLGSIVIHSFLAISICAGAAVTIWKNPKLILIHRW